MRRIGPILLVPLLAAFPAGAGQPRQTVGPPDDPVVATGPNGAYTVAVPAFSEMLAISGDSVAFAVGDHGRDRMFRIGAASADGTWRTLYTPPMRRPGYVGALVASPRRVVALRLENQTFSCVVGGECSPPKGVLVAGPVHGRLRRAVHATEQLAPTASCRRRIAQLEDFDVSASGTRIAYARRVRCLAPRRRGHSQVVVRSLGTGAVRVVHRGRAAHVQVAGRYVGFVPERRRARVAVVVDLRTGEVAYRARLGDGDWYSLGADGTLATALFRSAGTGRLAWYSPASPRRHLLPNRAAAFSAAPLIYAGGRIAYASRFDGYGGELSVTDLQGHTRVHARVAGSELLDAFAFDGERLAFAHTRYRPDQGRADDGLAAVCLNDELLVQARAPVVEVHSVDDPGRVAQVPEVPPYRSPRYERPECPERD